jgi:hypothetical protein
MRELDLEYMADLNPESRIYKALAGKAKPKKAEVKKPRSPSTAQKPGAKAKGTGANHSPLMAEVRKQMMTAPHPDSKLKAVQHGGGSAFHHSKLSEAAGEDVRKMALDSHHSDHFLQQVRAKHGDKVKDLSDGQIRSAYHTTGLRQSLVVGDLNKARTAGPHVGCDTCGTILPMADAKKVTSPTGGSHHLCPGCAQPKINKAVGEAVSGGNRGRRQAPLANHMAAAKTRGSAAHHGLATFVGAHPHEVKALAQTSKSPEHFHAQAVAKWPKLKGQSTPHIHSAFESGRNLANSLSDNDLEKGRNYGTTPIHTSKLRAARVKAASTGLKYGGSHESNAGSSIARYGRTWTSPHGTYHSRTRGLNNEHVHFTPKGTNTPVRVGSGRGYGVNDSHAMEHAIHEHHNSLHAGKAKKSLDDNDLAKGLKWKDGEASTSHGFYKLTSSSMGHYAEYRPKTAAQGWKKAPAGGKEWSTPAHATPEHAQRAAGLHHRSIRTSMMGKTPTKKSEAHMGDLEKGFFPKKPRGTRWASLGHHKLPEYKDARPHPYEHVKALKAAGIKAKLGESHFVDHKHLLVEHGKVGAATKIIGKRNVYRSLEAPDLEKSKSITLLDAIDLIEKSETTAKHNRAIGHTSTGKAIHHDGAYHTDFTTEEHEEAEETHSKLADAFSRISSRWSDGNGGLPVASRKHVQKMADHHRSMAAGHSRKAHPPGASPSFVNQTKIPAHFGIEETTKKSLFNEGSGMGGVPLSAARDLTTTKRMG